MLSTSPARAPGDTPERSLLKQQAYGELKRRIQDGTLRPGTFLSERQLAVELGMSKTPVRAALGRLESEGLISVAPQQGIVVRELPLAEIANQFEIRSALETFVLRRLAGNLRPEDAARLRQNLEDQRIAAEQKNIPACIALDADFHILFCEFLGNNEITRVMSQLREKIHRIVSRALELNPQRIDSGYAEHVAIAEALLAGDGELAARRLDEHLETGKRTLLSPRMGLST